ncbi:hypothetical protein B0H11DRAFT_2228260 [Mycena galericulata]|nr:hypothetical protein B0H11DRAFT_2228260 [Mycena galericulata]
MHPHCIASPVAPTRTPLRRPAPLDSACTCVCVARTPASLSKSTCTPVATHTLPDGHESMRDGCGEFRFPGDARVARDRRVRRHPSADRISAQPVHPPRLHTFELPHCIREGRVDCTPLHRICASVCPHLAPHPKIDIAYRAGSLLRAPAPPATRRTFAFVRYRHLLPSYGPPPSMPSHTPPPTFTARTPNCTRRLTPSSIAAPLPTAAFPRIRAPAPAPAGAPLRLSRNAHHPPPPRAAPYDVRRPIAEVGTRPSSAGPENGGRWR